MKRTYLFFLAYFILTNSFANEWISEQELQIGDVILFSFNCYECRVIESETNSNYSHSGVVLEKINGKILIGQSLGFVTKTELSEFLKYKTPNTFADVFRPKAFKYFTNENYFNLSKKFNYIFTNQFENAPFDVTYLWDNYDKHGRELLYCSEFIAKFLDYFLPTPTVPKLLSYQKNEEFWKKHFLGNIPQNVLGNSPVSFARDLRFFYFGSLQL